jgi:alkylhydroperoxidase family enzyme
MARRLEPLAPDAKPEVSANLEHYRQILGYMPTTVLVMLRVPRLVKALNQLAGAIWSPESEVDAGLKRLVAYTCGRVHDSHYSMLHAAKSAYAAGISIEKINAVEEYRTSPLFDEKERVTLDFAVAGASQPNAVTDELFGKMKQHWTETQIVEITAVIAMNGFLNRWNDTVAPPFEDAPVEFAKKNLKRKLVDKTR